MLSFADPGSSLGVACACLELFSGTAIGICVSLYAANIKFDYDHPHKGQRYGYEFGPCIYIGWGMWLICYLNSFMYFGLNWRRLTTKLDFLPSQPLFKGIQPRLLRQRWRI